METCSSGNLILDPSGNECQSDCDSGKIKFMPEGICIEQSLCDQNYYTLYNSNKECGLCSYFYSSTSKYKLVNTSGCLSEMPDNTEYYNENLFLLKCKTNYGLNSNNECVPEYCYERCATCSEIGTSETDQKCSTCNDGYTLENGNCIVPPTTIIIPPTTELIPPTTILPPPTTIITETPTEEKILETCTNKRCQTCSEGSDKDGLCLSCDENQYKKVYYTNKYSKYFNCFKEKI